MALDELLGILSPQHRKWLGRVLPKSVIRRIDERLRDFPWYGKIASNQDLRRGARVAWVRATLTVLNEAQAVARQMGQEFEHEFPKEPLDRFDAEARGKLVAVRDAALKRSRDLEWSPIDEYVEFIMQGASERRPPGTDGGTEGRITATFESTLAGLTGWASASMPTLPGRIARDGLPMKDTNRRRTFGELVCSEFAELLKSPTRYLELKEAFSVARADEARRASQAALDRAEDLDANVKALGDALTLEVRKLSEDVLKCLAGLDAQLDRDLAGRDALEFFQAGLSGYLDTLPKLLAGQARSEALLVTLAAEVRTVGDGVSSVHGDTQALLQGAAGDRAILGEVHAMLGSLTHAALLPGATKELVQARAKELIAWLRARDFDRVLAETQPTNLAEYRARCFAIWAGKDYDLDRKFKRLSLLLDRGAGTENDRFERVPEPLEDLREVLTQIKAHGDPRVIVVTGAPGSGKSTLLRGLELEYAWEGLSSGDVSTPVTFFQELNVYTLNADPGDWIRNRWGEVAGTVGSFDAMLRRPFVLLLDGLNEMQQGNPSQNSLAMRAWNGLLDSLVRHHPLLTVVITCRTRDYGQQIASDARPRVPQVEILPLKDDQVLEFLKAYCSEHADALWEKLDGSKELDLYRSPYFLHLLVQSVEGEGGIPKGAAALFTGYLRHLLKREVILRNNWRFAPGPIFDSMDDERLRNRDWHSMTDLPDDGLLFRGLSAFAHALQSRRTPEDKSHVRVRYSQALGVELVAVPAAQRAPLVAAAVDLQIVERPGNDLRFVHQLLQEYFAARHVAAQAQAFPGDLAALVAPARAEWRGEHIEPNLRDVLAALPRSGTLPDLRGTGWDETLPLAAAMLPAPDAFLRALAEVNLPLAGRCAAQPDVAVSDGLRDELRKLLVARSRDPDADLRARIAAGLALGPLGDPRFARHRGPHDDYLLPPMITVPKGTYTIGSEKEGHDNERPTREVRLDAFDLGRFPVTNAEYRRFIKAGGYREPRWWTTPAARRWRQGIGTADADKANWRYWRDEFRDQAGLLASMAEEGAWSDRVLNDWQRRVAMTEEAFEAALAAEFVDGVPIEAPRFWTDPAWNAPGQPVVGICWYEARAYCEWLSAQTERNFRLPTEAEWEAAARGPRQRRYAGGETFDPLHYNGLDTRWRRTTPVGVFPAGDTPAEREVDRFVDLTGNVWEWTASRYLRYDDPGYGVDDPEDAKSPRVLRGGSCSGNADNCRCACRNGNDPDVRNVSGGFRVCCSPPSVDLPVAAAPVTGPRDHRVSGRRA